MKSCEACGAVIEPVRGTGRWLSYNVWRGSEFVGMIERRAQTHYRADGQRFRTRREAVQRLITLHSREVEREIDIVPEPALERCPVCSGRGGRWIITSRNEGNPWSDCEHCSGRGVVDYEAGYRAGLAACGEARALLQRALDAATPLPAPEEVHDE